MKRRGWRNVGSDMSARSFKWGPLRIVQIRDDTADGKASSLTVSLVHGSRALSYENRAGSR